MTRTRIAFALAAFAFLAAAFWLVGRPAIRIQSPRADERVGIDGAELLVRFEPVGAVEPATVRVLLNGADVTGECTIGTNGLYAKLRGLLDGDNRVRVEGFVRAPAGLRVQEAREVRVRFRPPADFDRG